VGVKPVDFLARIRPVLGVPVKTAHESLRSTSLVKHTEREKSTALREVLGLEMIGLRGRLRRFLMF